MAQIKRNAHLRSFVIHLRQGWFVIDAWLPEWEAKDVNRHPAGFWEFMLN